jgi:thiamine transport system permease protein
MPTATARLARAALYSLPLLFLALFYLYPLASILRVSFASEGELDFTGVGATLASPAFWRVLWFTTWQAVASTALTLLLGLPLAAVFARYDFRGKAVLRALTTIPFVMPTVVVAAAFTSLVGPSGLLNVWLQRLFGLGAPPVQLMQTAALIIIVHAFYNVSVVVRTVGGFWESLNPALGEAGRVLGAARLRLFREVTLPLLLPSIAASSLLVFLFCFTSFGVVLILGGLRFATLEVEIYNQAVNLFRLPVAAFLCLVQMALTFAVMAVYTRVQARAALPLEFRPEGSSARRPATWRARLLVAAAMVAMVVFLLAPLLALAWRSFTLGPDTFTLRYYAELTLNRRQSAFFVPPVAAIRNSLVYAAAATLLSLALGVISAYLLARPRSRLSAVLDPIFLLPLGTSAVTLGFGYIVAMGAWRTSLWLVPVAHTLIAMPFVVRTFLPALRSLDPHLREAAAVLGAAPVRRWWEVDVPILRRALLVAAAFAFTISLGEFGATLLISRPDAPTMPMIIYRALGQPGLANYGQALAMSTILMGVCALALVAIERFRLPGEEF